MSKDKVYNYTVDNEELQIFHNNMRLSEEMRTELFNYFYDLFDMKIKKFFPHKELNSAEIMRLTNVVTSTLVADTILIAMKMHPYHQRSEISMIMMDASQRLIEGIVNEYFVLIKDEEDKKNE